MPGQDVYREFLENNPFGSTPNLRDFTKVNKSLEASKQTMIEKLTLAVEENIVEPDFEQECNDLRSLLKSVENRTRLLLNHSSYKQDSEHHGERRAQTMLTVRHLEDARMRIGKMLQYTGDGISILDKK